MNKDLEYFDAPRWQQQSQLLLDAKIGLVRELVQMQAVQDELVEALRNLELYAAPFAYTKGADDLYTHTRKAGALLERLKAPQSSAR
jgi:hypothetical protein